MINRYNKDPEMARIWTDEHRFGLWLQIENQICNEWLVEDGKEPIDMLTPWTNEGDLNPLMIQRIQYYETKTGHEMTAFISAIIDALPDDCKNVPIHKGATSSDIMDTALTVQMKEANTIVDRNIGKLMHALLLKASDTADDICLGMTHLQPAIPLTFGHRLSVFRNQLEIARDKWQRLKYPGKISGPVGTNNEINPDMEGVILRHFGLETSRGTTQVVSRVYHADIMQAMAMISSVLATWATNFRLLSTPSIGEVEEGGRSIRDGSSAMPHKHNPIKCENIVSLSRLIDAYLHIGMQNIQLWLERDLTNSANERIYIPQAHIIINHMIVTMTKVIENLVVNNDRMWDNVQNSPEVMSAVYLSNNMSNGMTRVDAYREAKKEARTSDIVVNQKDIVELFLKNI